MRCDALMLHCASSSIYERRTASTASTASWPITTSLQRLHGMPHAHREWAGQSVQIHPMNTVGATGNPPYSIPPYSSQCAAANRVKCARGEVLTAGQTA